MSKHTEGQWNIYVSENSEPTAIYAGDNRVTVCDFRIRSNRETLQADANLIAASPDLLEALEDMTARFVRCCEYSGTVERKMLAEAT